MFFNQSSPVNRHFSRNTAHKSNKYAVKGKMGTAVKTSAGCDHPLKHMEHRGIFDSGCSGKHDWNRVPSCRLSRNISIVGSATFGGSKGKYQWKKGNLVRGLLPRVSKYDQRVLLVEGKAHKASLDALALKHLGPVPATAPTRTNPVNTGSDILPNRHDEHHARFLHIHSK
ncbi:hypothetical protein Tco_1485702 [Tanacetum coccineum]